MPTYGASLRRRLAHFLGRAKRYHCGMVIWRRNASMDVVALRFNDGIRNANRLLHPRPYGGQRDGRESHGRSNSCIACAAPCTIVKVILFSRRSRCVHHNELDLGYIKYQPNVKHGWGGEARRGHSAEHHRAQRHGFHMVFIDFQLRFYSLLVAAGERSGEA